MKKYIHFDTSYSCSDNDTLSEGKGEGVEVKYTYSNSSVLPNQGEANVQS